MDTYIFLLLVTFKVTIIIMHYLLYIVIYNLPLQVTICRLQLYIAIVNCRLQLYLVIYSL